MDNEVIIRFIAGAKAFFQVPTGASFWDVINSPFLVGLVAAFFGFQLNRRFNQQARRFADVEDEVEAVTDSTRYINDELNDEEAELVDEAISPDTETNELGTDFAQDEFIAGAPIDEVERSFASIGSSENYRRETAEIVSRLKDYLSQKIASDQDKRHHRTYDKISGHHPLARARALFEREQLKPREYESTVSILKAWKRYASGKGFRHSVPKAIYVQISREARTLGI